ncbi:N-acetylmuramoyl-L-alanine amidase [Clostridium sp. D46t1_190503_E9]|uniref:peptidoglycan recognition protein family protein n=1 Tax=Clostridium sp. D46t1_190503_E9 TaxID=2787137 RepID=UPI00189B9B39|nr:N-acetylmuramoyl-L-alanine amidase [Clostridium sp. D46t1_190503_E9]
MLKQMLIDSGKYGVKCPYSMAPKGICIHNTANDAPASNEIAYMISNNNEVSFHIAIDDTEAIQGIPFNRNTWHAGDGGSGEGNRNYISVEICYSKSGGLKFINAEKRAAKEVAALLKQYGWTINNVKKHRDFSNKYCPHLTLDLGWQRFLNMIQAELNTSTGNNNVNNEEMYRIRKSWGDTASQLGAFRILESAKKFCQNGYYVFNNKGEKIYPIEATNSKKYLNLKPHVPSWRVYSIDKAPVVGNECAKLAPATYGGLSYEILEDKGDIKIIKTEMFGKVQIYAPRDNDSLITENPIY